jgi:hypothetical protein
MLLLRTLSSLQYILTKFLLKTRFRLPRLQSRGFAGREDRAEVPDVMLVQPHYLNEAPTTSTSGASRRSSKLLFFPFLIFFLLLFLLCWRDEFVGFRPSTNKQTFNDLSFLYRKRSFTLYIDGINLLLVN